MTTTMVAVTEIQCRRALDVLGSGAWMTFGEMVGEGDLPGRRVLRGGLRVATARGLVRSRPRVTAGDSRIEYQITERGLGAMGRWA